MSEIKMDKIAIITARGGSKRIPHKNIKNFCGKPILAYSIEAALESKVFDEVMVSTDSEEIANVAINYGANVPFFRSEKNADDFATTSDVLLEVLNEYEKRGKKFEIACCIYPTAPFVMAKHLLEAVAMIKNKKADIVMPVTEFSYPPQRGLIQKEDKSVRMVLPQYMDARSQDLKKIYHDCGQYYVFKVSEFQKNKSILNGRIWPVIVSELEMQDIDNESDWKLAEIKYKLLMEQSTKKKAAQYDL